MSYEAKMDAASDYASEVAYEAFQEGAFDGEIVEMILSGYFDDAVRKRCKMLRKKK